MNTKPIQCYKVTFEAIQSVRMELATHAKAGNHIEANECLTRLSNLYASIDAVQFIECMNALESMQNVVVVDFKAKKPEPKQEVVNPDYDPAFTYDDIPF